MHHASIVNAMIHSKTMTELMGRRLADSPKPKVGQLNKILPHGKMLQSIDGRVHGRLGSIGRARISDDLGFVLLSAGVWL